MSGKRAKVLKEQARLASLDGSVVGSHEYKRLKKLHTNPHYGQVVVLYPTEPDIMFRGARVLERGVRYPFNK